MELKDVIKAELESGNVIKLSGQLDHEYTLVEKIDNIFYKITSRIRSLWYVTVEEGIVPSIRKNFRHVKLVRKLLG